MIVRSLTEDGDWTFGKGKNDYMVNQMAISQMVKTRLQSFIGDCFFAVDEGIDWFNLLGSKQQIQLELAVRAVILNTEGVTGIVSSEIALDSGTRRINMTYVVNTIYSVNGINDQVSDFTSLLLTEDGNVLTTEDGSGLELG